MAFLSPQVNVHALLAYVGGPRELDVGDEDVGGKTNIENDLPANAMLRGRAYQR